MADQPELPGTDLNTVAPYVVRSTKSLASMWSRFGPGPAGTTCKDCVALRGYQNRSGRRTYYKCGVYGVSSGPGTDWRVKWPACGYFEKKPPKTEKP